MDVIDTGTYWVRVTCPGCGQVEDVALGPVAQLQRTAEDAQLRVKVGQKPAAHRCGQLRLVDVDRATGEIMNEPDLQRLSLALL